MAARRRADAGRFSDGAGGAGPRPKDRPKGGSSARRWPRSWDRPGRAARTLRSRRVAEPLPPRCRLVLVPPGTSSGGVERRTLSDPVRVEVRLLEVFGPSWACGRSGRCIRSHPPAGSPSKRGKASFRWASAGPPARTRASVAAPARIVVRMERDLPSRVLSAPRTSIGCGHRPRKPKRGDVGRSSTA